MMLKINFTSLFVVLFFPFFLSAQETQFAFCISPPPAIEEYALIAKSKAFPHLSIKDMSLSEKFIFEKNICDRAMGRNLCPRISKSPFLIKEICRIGKRLNNFRKIQSKCGNITYRLNENGVSMKFYLTRYYMSQP